MNNIFEEYAQTKEIIANLTNKLKDLEPKLLKKVSSSEEPIKNDFGTFTKQTRNSYKFSKIFEDWIYAQKQQLAKKQKVEIEAGRVEVEQTISLRFIPKNEK